MEYDYQILTTPLPTNMVAELVAWWESIFELDLQWLWPVLSGGETEHVDSYLYVARKQQEVVATCHLWHSRSDRRLGCLGEVATAPDHRQRGLGKRVCTMAANDFEGQGGQALFLGTSNPAAANMYEQLGWGRVPGSNAMVHLKNTASCREYLADYFQNGFDLPVRILPGSPQHRVTMIALLLSAHDWVVLDSNAKIISTKFACQESCEGLYSHYGDLPEPSVWLVAARSDGAVVGLASVQFTDEGSCRLDAFTHGLYQNILLADLYKEAVRCAQRWPDRPLYITCAENDALKKQALRELAIDKLLPIKYIPFTGK